MNAQRQDPKPAPQTTPAQLTTAPAHPQPAKSATATLDRPHDDHAHVDEPGYGHGV
jgi:hypothetical protein